MRHNRSLRICAALHFFLHCKAYAIILKKTYAKFTLEESFNPVKKIYLNTTGKFISRGLIPRICFPSRLEKSVWSR